VDAKLQHELCKLATIIVVNQTFASLNVALRKMTSYTKCHLINQGVKQMKQVLKSVASALQSVYSRIFDRTRSLQMGAD
jgi:hypothetical protein